jgi:hypothetical protein
LVVLLLCPCPACLAGLTPLLAFFAWQSEWLHWGARIRLQTSHVRSPLCPFAITSESSSPKVHAMQSKTVETNALPVQTTARWSSGMLRLTHLCTYACGLPRPTHFGDVDLRITTLVRSTACQIPTRACMHAWCMYHGMMNRWLLAARVTQNPDRDH